MPLLTDSDLEQISQTMADYDCAYWGLRIVAGPVDADQPLPPSRIWVDGVASQEVLAGTSAVAVDMQGRPLADLRGYELAAGPCAVLMLIGGDAAAEGEDSGELVIEDAYCYWHRVLA